MLKICFFLVFQYLIQYTKTITIAQGSTSAITSEVDIISKSCTLKDSCNKITLLNSTLSQKISENGIEIEDAKKESFLKLDIGSLFEDSLILDTPEKRSTFLTTTGALTISPYWKKLHTSSIDGWLIADAFDNMGTNEKLMLIVKTTAGYIIGGYNPFRWSNHDGYVDVTSYGPIFIWSLESQTKHPLTSIPEKSV